MKIKMMNENSEQNNTSVEWHEEEVAAKNEQMNLPWNARDGDGKGIADGINDRTKKWRWIIPGDPDEPAVDPDLSSTLQTQNELDRMLMKSSIEKYGVMDSVKVWAGKRVIVDGHNRVRICAELGVPYPVEEIEFADAEAAKKWMKDHQLGRRNLTAFARCEMVIDLEPELREQSEKNHGKRSDLDNFALNLGRSSRENRTSHRLADLAGISHGTFDKAKWLLESTDARTKESLRAGTISIHKGWKATKWFLNDIDDITKHRIEIGETTVIEAYDEMRKAAKKAANEERDEDDDVEYEDDAAETEGSAYEDDSEDAPDETSGDAESNVISILPYLKRRNQGMAGMGNQLSSYQQGGHRQGGFQNSLGSANPHPMVKPQSPLNPKSSNSECKIISILPYLDNPNWAEEEEEESNSRNCEAAAKYEDEHDRYDDLPDPDPRFARHVRIEDIKVSRPTKEQLARRYANDDGEEDTDGLEAGSNNEHLAISDFEALARALRKETNQYVTQMVSLLTAFKNEAMTEDDRIRLPAILDDCLNIILNSFAGV